MPPTPTAPAHTPEHGARHFPRVVRVNPRSDLFPVLAFHHVELWCADAAFAAGRFSFALGARLAARSDLSTGNSAHASLLLRSGVLAFLFPELARFDHVGGNVPELAPVAAYMAGFTGFNEFAEFTAEDVGTAESGLDSVALANNSEAVLLGLNKPVHDTSRRSQIQTYLEYHGGPACSTWHSPAMTCSGRSGRFGRGPPWATSSSWRHPSRSTRTTCVSSQEMCSRRRRSRNARSWGCWWIGMTKECCSKSSPSQ